MVVCNMIETNIGVLFDKIKELENENEQLKTQINNISAQRDEFHHGVRENANQIGRLEKENKELKKQIQPIQKICQKYTIPIEDLPEVLEEYITLDNEWWSE